MKTLIKYFKATGRINTFMTTNADLDISNYIDDIFDALIIENFSESIVSFDDYYVKNGKLMPCPEKPEGFYVWDGIEWVIDIERNKQKVLNLRQAYLQESDWTDTVSAKTRLGDALYQAWQDYRQALRDITLQPDYPLEVIWPIAPL